MLTHHNPYSSSMLECTGRSMDQHDPSGSLANGPHYSTRQQELTTVSRPHTLFPISSCLASTSTTHHNLGYQPSVPHPIEINSTTSTQHLSAFSSAFAPANVVPSPPTSFPSSASHLRYDVVLEAPPAAAHRTEDSPLTYLNKSQFYIINLADMDNYDGVVTSTLTLMFHEESHRRISGNYWRFWFGQQKKPQTARAIDINVPRCSGIQNVQYDQFDRVTFDWNGRRGAAIHVRFNCLSTDFSRIKGVKGIPLRLHMETSQTYFACNDPSITPPLSHNNQQQQTIEAAYCKIKLFRDKGAERKNKDDTRQLERQMEKLRVKHGEAHPLWLTYPRAQPFTVFSEIPECISPPAPIIQHLSPTVKPVSVPGSSILLQNHAVLASPPSSMAAIMTPSAIVNAPLTPPRGKKRSATMAIQQDDYLGHAATRGLVMADIDRPYVPLVLQRAAKRLFFVRFPPSEFYRAIYLEELSVTELIAKVGSKIAFDGPVRNVVREVLRKESSATILVSVDDAMVQDILEEQDMDIDAKKNQDGTMTLVLRY